MGETRLEFVWPSPPGAIQVLLILMVLPGWLIWLLFKYTSLSRWKKALLLPVCLIAPLLVTPIWPFLLAEFEIIKLTGPGDQLSYSWYRYELFGRFSDYVWMSVTALAILILQGVLKLKATPPPPIEPTAGNGG